MIKLFVGGIPKNTDEMQLAQLFGPHGDIITLSIAYDKISGQRKSFGFIEMASEEGASQAIAALNGFILGDHQLEVRIAAEKKQPIQKPAYVPRTAPISANSRPEKKKRPRIAK